MLAPVLMLVSSALQPPFAEGHAGRLAELDQAGATAWVSNILFILTQVPMLVAFLGIAHLLRQHAPRISIIATGLGVLASFGEAVMGGTGLIYLAMSSDSANRQAFAGVWEKVESSPVMLFAIVGFGGTVLTLVLLSIGLFRSAIVSRWVPVLVWSFLLLEFAGSNLTRFASYAAGLCLLLAFGTIARLVWQSPPTWWDTTVVDADEMRSTSRNDPSVSAAADR
jgi:hypothetical protein